MDNISIVIPVLNEEDNLENLINEIMKNHLIEIITEIILVDDFSKDNSKIIILSLSKIFNKIKFYAHDKNYGQSKALLTGIKNAKNNIIITLDADGQNNPNDIKNLYKCYIKKNKIKLVGGIRKVRKDSLTKIYSSKIANKIRKFILNDDCEDSGCSLKIFDKEMFLKLPFFDGLHRFLPALFKYSGSENVFIEVDHRERKYGYSKYDNLYRAIKGIIDLYKVKKIINNINNGKLYK